VGAVAPIPLLLPASHLAVHVIPLPVRQ